MHSYVAQWCRAAQYSVAACWFLTGKFYQITITVQNSQGLKHHSRTHTKHVSKRALWPAVRIRDRWRQTAPAHRTLLHVPSAHADGMATLRCQPRHGPLRLLTRTAISLSFRALEACSLPLHFVSQGSDLSFLTSSYHQYVRLCLN